MAKIYSLFWGIGPLFWAVSEVQVDLGVKLKIEDLVFPSLGFLSSSSQH